MNDIDCKFIHVPIMSSKVRKESFIFMENSLGGILCRAPSLYRIHALKTKNIAICF